MDNKTSPLCAPGAAPQPVARQAAPEHAAHPMSALAGAALAPESGADAIGAPAPAARRCASSAAPGAGIADRVGGRGQHEEVAIGLADRTPWLALAGAPPAAGALRRSAAPREKGAVKKPTPPGANTAAPHANDRRKQGCCGEFGDCRCVRCGDDGRRI